MKKGYSDMVLHSVVVRCRKVNQKSKVQTAENTIFGAFGVPGNEPPSQIGDSTVSGYVGCDE